MTVERLAADLREGHATATALAGRALERADVCRRELGAFVTVTEELAVAGARRADEELARGVDRGPLHGIPVAVKDVIDVAGVPTRNGTPGLGHRTPARDAPAWAVLRDAGAVLIGKTTTHELAWGTTTPGCRNPLAPERSAGGSSAGSAAAVAAGAVPIALGTDTGGSVRIPAALCGVAGFRPAMGMVDMEGVTPLAPSQDVVGPIATSAAACAAVASLLTGRPAEPAGADAFLRVGVPAGRWRERLDSAVATGFAAVCGALTGGGLAEVVHLDVPLVDLAPAASYVTMLAESGRRWWPEAAAAPASAGPAVRALLRVGSGIGWSDARRARQVAAEIRRSLATAMEQQAVDVCALPTVPVTARPAADATTVLGGRQVTVDAAYSLLTALASVSGLAALTVPCGADGSGLPVGLQLIAFPAREAAIWELAARLERG